MLQRAAKKKYQKQPKLKQRSGMLFMRSAGLTGKLKEVGLNSLNVPRLMLQHLRAYPFLAYGMYSDRQTSLVK